MIGPRFYGSATISPVPNPTNPYAGPTDPATLAWIAATNPGTQNRIFRNGYQNIKVYTLAAEFVRRMDWATITVPPSYVGSKIQTLQYTALVVTSYLNSKSDSLAIETRLSAPVGNRIQWVVGAYGSLEDVNDESQSRVGFPGPGGSFVTPAISPQRNDRTVAGFGEITASLTNRLRVIGGDDIRGKRRILSDTRHKSSARSHNFRFFAPTRNFLLPGLSPMASYQSRVQLSGRGGI